MKHLLIACLALLLPVAAAAAPSTPEVDEYLFDKGHTSILFFVNHLGNSDMVGRFTDYDGHFFFDKDRPEKSAIDVTLKPAGIVTSSKALDEHLQAKDWFNTAQFPEIRFVSTGVKITGKQDGEVTGNVTMLGVTRPVTLKVHFNKADYHPKTSQFVAGFSADATVKRSEFGMKNGIPMVGDDVRIHIETEGFNQRLKPGQGVPKH